MDKCKLGAAYSSPCAHVRLPLEQTHAGEKAKAYRGEGQKRQSSCRGCSIIVITIFATAIIVAAITVPTPSASTVGVVILAAMNQSNGDN